MKNYFIECSVALFMLLFVSCAADQSDPSQSVGSQGSTQPVTTRNCPGDDLIVTLEKGKCKNDCTRGISYRCGGKKESSRCGVHTIAYGSCDEAFSESADWVAWTPYFDSDTTDNVHVRVEFPDRYHAKFVFLNDISADLAIDSDFTINNNIRWEDTLGYTFGSTTYHYFQYIGGDYPITVSSTYPYGMALVDISSY